MNKKKSVNTKKNKLKTNTSKEHKKKKLTKHKHGFTLIELLAVIVILGLLMAIAIPSITKYITQSRRKTLVNTINGYVTAISNEVNDQDYFFSTPNIVFAVPIECISLEKGGTNPFGEWSQANENYWAYVLVQYDAENFTYKYGFTFKDSSGYGMYPTEIGNISQTSSSQIVTGLSLKRPKSGSYINVATKEQWTGFDIQDDTQVIVLQTGSEGQKGDGKTMCTLMQKGDNYELVEQEKEELEKKKLNNLIKQHNTIITTKPTLTTSSSVAGDQNGLYLSTATNSGNPTYYFRGNVSNNYVKFAGFTWRIIRINEDGTVRLIYSGGIGGSNFNSTYCDVKYMYYSNSDTTKAKVDTWYNDNLSSYSSYIAYGSFCEQAKVKISSGHTSGDASMIAYNDYTPNFRCSTDGNEKGILNLKIGIVTYDEVAFAGAYYGINSNSYLGTINTVWTMSPAGYSGCLPYVWLQSESLGSQHTFNTGNVRPVINLNADVTATGIGTSGDPYIIETE